MSESTDRWSVSLDGETLLGRYRVERMIGGGGMANVYLAHDEQLEIPVVVKVPHAAFLAEQGFRERFDRETRDLVTLQHPHIVRIHARGEHEDMPFLVMQFLQGGSLGDRMRKAKGPMPYEAVEPWMRDVARALDFIHEQGVVHRDIKPDNVLFDEYGHAYLSDFGIAKAVGGADTGLTVTGATPGSPAFMAPEQARTNTLTGASDQYSFAATLYEALSGRPTFEGETVVDVLIKKQSKLPTPLSEYAPQLPAGVAPALMRALARTPEERFPTCLAMVDAMGGAAATGTDAAAASEDLPPVAVAAVAAPTPIHAAPAPTTVLRRPVAAEDAAPRTTSVGRTLTLGGARQAMWVVFALLVGVPLAFFLMPGDDDAPNDETHTAAIPSPMPPKDEDPGDPPAVPAQPEEGLVGLIRKGAEKGDRPIGDYVLDTAALRERLKTLRPRDGKRKGMRPPPGLRELGKLLVSGFSLQVKKDGGYELRFEDASEEARVMRGRWQRVGQLLEFRPTAIDSSGAKDRRRLEPFKARMVQGGMYLIRAGQEVFLKRR